MKLSLYFVIGLTIFMVVPHLVLSDDPVETAQPDTGSDSNNSNDQGETGGAEDPSASGTGDQKNEASNDLTDPAPVGEPKNDGNEETKPSTDDESKALDKIDTNEDQSETVTEAPKQPTDDQSESTEEPKTDENLTDLPPSDNDNESVEPPNQPVDPVAEEVSTTPAPKEPTEPETESPKEPTEPETESPKETDKPDPKGHPKISFWQKLKFALSPKSPHFYIFIGVFGFIFVALCIFAYSRLFIHPQQRGDIASRAERGARDNSRHETLQLDCYRTATVVVTA